MEILLLAISGMLLLAGLVFFLGTTIGLARFPTFYTRMHAAGKADTLSSLLILLAFAILELRQFDGVDLLTCGKLIMIMGFVFTASRTATHALMDAGYKCDGFDEDGLEEDES